MRFGIRPLAPVIVKWGREALPRFELADVPKSISHGTGVLGLSDQDALAQGISVPEMPQNENVVQPEPTTFRMRNLRTSNVRDGGHDFPQKPYSFEEVVLGDLLNGDLLQRHLHAQPPEASGNQDLPGGLADGP